MEIEDTGVEIFRGMFLSKTVTVELSLAEILKGLKKISIKNKKLMNITKDSTISKCEVPLFLFIFLYDC